MLTSFLQERVFSKTKSIRAPVPLSKRFTFTRKPDMEKSGEVLKGKAAEMEQSTFKAVIDLVEVSKLVKLSELLEHRVVEECVAYSISMAPTGKHRRAHLCRSSLCRSVDLQEPYIAVIDMGMVWSKRCRTTDLNSPRLTLTLHLCS